MYLTGPMWSFCVESSQFVTNVGWCRPVSLPSLTDGELLVEGCVKVERSFVSDHIDLYYVVYYCFRVIFIHFVPCCALVVLNAMLGRPAYVYTQCLADRL